jgi:DNA (cytosine-5)-methyltransferase 1
MKTEDHLNTTIQTEPCQDSLADSTSKLKVASIFTGIAGIERGLALAGHETEFMCEIDPGARAVLGTHFPGMNIRRDITRVRALPKADVVAAGFPCNDLSQVGPATGIGGTQSRLVSEVFRLVQRGRRTQPLWLLLENVPFMLRLNGGKAIRYIVSRFDEEGYRWAYRIVDTRAFGLPQRRRRVIIAASRTEDPREVLLVDEAADPPFEYSRNVACGFYWTEGNRGVGWAIDAVPTLKGSSSIGITSPPAIWMPGGEIVMPNIRDAERLQGFPPGWTLPATQVGGMREGARWKLVGNAVSVPVARWVGRRLVNPKPYFNDDDECLGSFRRLKSWPDAAWGENGKVYRADITAWPVNYRYKHLAEFLRYPSMPLRERAAAGFLNRARASTLTFVDGFLDAIDAHLEMLRAAA